MPRYGHSRKRPTSPAIDSLSPRELQVALGLLKGLSYKEIAGGLGISDKTVETYVNAVYRRLGVGCAVELLWKLAGEQIQEKVTDRLTAMSNKDDEGSRTGKWVWVEEDRDMETGDAIRDQIKRQIRS